MISKICDFVFFMILCAFVCTAILCMARKLTSDDVVEYESWSRRECVFIEVNGIKKSCDEMPDVASYEHVWVQ